MAEATNLNITFCTNIECTLSCKRKDKPKKHTKNVVYKLFMPASEFMCKFRI